MDVCEKEMDCGRLRLQVTESFFRMASFDHLESRIAHRTHDQKADERFVCKRKPMATYRIGCLAVRLFRPDVSGLMSMIG